MFLNAQYFTQTSVIASSLLGVVNSLVAVAFAAALLFFFWGVAKYILASGDEDAKIQGRRIIIVGIIALFVISAIGGILYFIGGELGIPLDSGGGGGAGSCENVCGLGYYCTGGVCYPDQ